MFSNQLRNCQDAEYVNLGVELTEHISLLHKVSNPAYYYYYWRVHKANHNT